MTAGRGRPRGRACASRVSPADALRSPSAWRVPHGPPTMAGRLVADGDDLCFVPRFPFVDATELRGRGGRHGAHVVRVATDARRPATTEVVAIRPDARVTVPRNLLRCYVEFSAPMREATRPPTCGWSTTPATRRSSAPCCRPSTSCGIPTGAGSPSCSTPPRINAVALRIARSATRCARETTFRLVVDAGFRDTWARRSPRAPSGGGRSAPTNAATSTPRPGRSRRQGPAVGIRSSSRSTVLDHTLVGACLQVVGPSGDPLAGAAAVGAEARSWSYTPSAPRPGPTTSSSTPPSRTFAGNSLTRVFDRDLSRPRGRPRPARPLAIPFTPR